MTRATRQLERLLGVLQDPNLAKENLTVLRAQEESLRDALREVNGARAQGAAEAQSAAEAQARREAEIEARERKLAFGQVALDEARRAATDEAQVVERARRAFEEQRERSSLELTNRETALANATSASARELDSRAAGLEERAARLAEVEASLTSREAKLAESIAVHETKAKKLADTLKEMGNG